MAGLQGGFAAIRKASQELTDRKNSGGNFGPKELWPALKNSGDSVVVRFLEQGDEVHVAFMHELPNRKRPEFVVCLDQDGAGNACPGCDQNLKRTIKGFINVIWRDSPQLKRGEDGRATKNNAGQYEVESVKDEIAAWMQGITVFEDLADKDLTYRGLTSRDFKITRRGTGLNTKYTIDPVLDENGNANSTPLTEADQKLVAEKYDLDKEYLPNLTYEEAEAIIGGQARDGGGVTEEAVQEKRTQGSPFNRGANDSNDGGRANRFLS